MHYSHTSYVNVPKSDKSVLLTVDINLSRQKVHTRCAGSEDILGGDGDSDEGQHYNPQIWEQHSTQPCVDCAAATNMRHSCR